jgi:hypothetical protein
MLQQQLMELLAYDRQRRLEQELVQRALLKTRPCPAPHEHSAVQNPLHQVGVRLMQWGLTLPKKAHLPRLA